MACLGSHVRRTAGLRSALALLVAFVARRPTTSVRS